MKRRHAISTALAACLVPTAFTAGAEDAFPSKPIRIVVPFGAGSAPDVMARLVADRLAPAVGKPVIVENKVGASGIIGTEFVARAPADGHTLLIGTPSTTILAASNRKLNFDPVKDLQPVAMGVTMSPILVTGERSPIKDVRTLIALAKAQPGKMNFGSGGIGNSQHLAAEMLKQMAGIDMQHVPFQSTAAVIPGLVNGEVAVMFADASSLPLIKSGKIRALAVGSPVRSKAVPEVPTVAESGVPGFSYQSWYGFMTTGGTPAQVVDYLNRAIGRCLGDPEVRAKLSAAGMEVSTGTQEQMAGFIAEDTKRWSKVIQTAQIKFD
jgi:tripartite-type tricarboxylate transporter receptor subunit TctC